MKVGILMMVLTALCKITLTSIFAFVALTALVMNASAQIPTPTPVSPTVVPTAAQTPPADSKDVATMDAIVAAVYDVISGPAGQKRNWDRFRSLFIPGARLIPTGRRQTGEVGSRVLTPEDYVTRSSPLLEQNGFFEREVSRRVAKFGNIAHAFSTYESRHTLNDPKP